MEIKTLQREFVIKESGVKLADVDPNMTVEEIQQLYAAQYPQLTVATYTKAFKGDKWVYTFKSTVGTKG